MCDFSLFPIYSRLKVFFTYLISFAASFARSDSMNMLMEPHNGDINVHRAYTRSWKYFFSLLFAYEIVEWQKADKKNAKWTHQFSRKNCHTQSIEQQQEQRNAWKRMKTWQLKNTIYRAHNREKQIFHSFVLLLLSKQNPTNFFVFSWFVFLGFDGSFIYVTWFSFCFSFLQQIK